MRSPGAWLALAAIGAYRRFISPFKGYECAWRVCTGGRSCSAYGAHVVARHGLLRGARLLQRRLARCAEVHRRHRGDADAWKASNSGHGAGGANGRALRRPSAQRGVCAFDLPCHVDAGDCCNAASCFDLPWRGRQQGRPTTRADRDRRRRRGQPASHPTRRP